ncbi:MAG: chloramphenicol acetyltransferase CAT [Oscillospiraceae bacterium]|nr:chloramphenicol acetyltransferase CAT [Oscillospiraceae bacterium]
MKMLPIFTPFDMQSWNRREIFHYFSQMAPTCYSITIKLDITDTKSALVEKKLKFFPTYLWLMTTAVNRFPEMTTAVYDGKVGRWNCLTPLYAQFHEDDKSISLLHLQYDDSFSGFYQSYIENQQKFGDKHGLLPQAPDFPPPNSYTVSALPWVEFDSFSLQTKSESPYYFPTIECGKMIVGERVLLPISITVSHAVCDGWHISEFIKSLEQMLNNPKEWINS